MGEKNPVQEAMVDLGYSAKQFAMVLDLNYSTVQSHLQGMPKRLSNQIAHALIRFGYSPQELREQYSAWRKEQAEKLKQAHMA